LSGDQIKEILEAGVSYGREKGGGLAQVSGMSYAYDLKRRKWDRIVRMSLNGQDMDLGRTYKVALNSYLAAGLGGYYTVKNIKNRYDTGLLDSDIIIRYIKNNPPLSLPDIGDRISEIK